MQNGAPLEQRREQKVILRQLYSDYDPKRHDVFVIRYNKDQDSKAFEAYCKNRGIIKETQ